jgi:hypothetical protein
MTIFKFKKYVYFSKIINFNKFKIQQMLYVGCNGKTQKTSFLVFKEGKIYKCRIFTYLPKIYIYIIYKYNQIWVLPFFLIHIYAQIEFLWEGSVDQPLNVHLSRFHF